MQKSNWCNNSFFFPDEKFNEFCLHKLTQNLNVYLGALLTVIYEIMKWNSKIVDWVVQNIEKVESFRDEVHWRRQYQMNTENRPQN